MTDPSSDRIPAPIRRSCQSALRLCAKDLGTVPTSKAYEIWRRGLEPLLLLRAYVAGHRGAIPTAAAFDEWLASNHPAAAARWSSAQIERAHTSLRRAVAAASRLGPIVPESPQGEWVPLLHTILSSYGSWREALLDAGVLRDRR